MKKIAFFDTKPYDKESFERQNKSDCPRRNGGRCPVSEISQGK